MKHVHLNPLTKGTISVLIPKTFNVISRYYIFFSIWLVPKGISVEAMLYLWRMHISFHHMQLPFSGRRRHWTSKYPTLTFENPMLNWQEFETAFKKLTLDFYEFVLNSMSGRILFIDFVLLIIILHHCVCF